MKKIDCGYEIECVKEPNADFTTEGVDRFSIWGADCTDPVMLDMVGLIDLRDAITLQIAQTNRLPTPNEDEHLKALRTGFIGKGILAEQAIEILLNEIEAV